MEVLCDQLSVGVFSIRLTAGRGHDSRMEACSRLNLWLPFIPRAPEWVFCFFFFSFLPASPVAGFLRAIIPDVRMKFSVRELILM
jgi:hypothetical protein